MLDRVTRAKEEIRYWQGMYNAQVEANAKLMEIVSRQHPTAAIIDSVMTGFKAVMNPDIPQDKVAITDPYGDIERALQKNPSPDPAWELDDIIGPLPDGYVEAEYRETMEDHG